MGFLKRILGGLFFGSGEIYLLFLLASAYGELAEGKVDLVLGCSVNFGRRKCRACLPINV